jgi:hypothetical protein
MWRPPVVAVGAALVICLAAPAAGAPPTPAAGRLRMIVVPAQLRPGQAAIVDVADSARRGDVAATVCASSSSAATRCRKATLAPGAITRRVRVTLPRSGRWTIALRSASGQRLTRHVDVRRDARLRLLVAGDSLTFGLIQTVARDLGSRAAVAGDPRPGTGITKSDFDWTRHARLSARTVRPDLTIMWLGSSDDSFALAAASAAPVPCCGPAWIDAYSRRVAAVMRAYLRDGAGLVYWLKLPAPQRTDLGPVFAAENAAIARAAAGFDDGVRLITRVADVLSPDARFHRSVVFRGRSRVVRDEDGVHLAASGIRIASDVVRAAMRGDGLLP